MEEWIGRDFVEKEVDARLVYYSVVSIPAFPHFVPFAESDTSWIVVDFHHIMWVRITRDYFPRRLQMTFVQQACRSHPPLRIDRLETLQTKSSILFY